MNRDKEFKLLKAAYKSYLAAEQALQGRNILIQARLKEIEKGINRGLKPLDLRDRSTKSIEKTRNVALDKIDELFDNISTLANDKQKEKIKYLEKLESFQKIHTISAQQLIELFEKETGKTWKLLEYKQNLKQVRKNPWKTEHCLSIDRFLVCEGDPLFDTINKGITPPIKLAIEHRKRDTLMHIWTKKCIRDQDLPKDVKQLEWMEENLGNENYMSIFLINQGFEVQENGYKVEDFPLNQAGVNFICKAIENQYFQEVEEEKEAQD